MPKITVLKPFTFSRPPGKAQKLPTEQKFEPGEREIDNEMAAHPWIEKDFADGAIESPAQARARLEAAKAGAEQAARDAEVAKAQAEATFARVSAAASQTASQNKETEKELNTPVNEVGAQRGAGVDSSTPGEQPPPAPPAQPTDGASSTTPQGEPDSGNKTKSKSK